MAKMLIFSLVLCLVAVKDVDGATYSNMQSLVTTLFTSYNFELRPFIDDHSPTLVYMGIQLYSIQELDEIDQSLTFTAFLYLDWTDNRLIWDPLAYNNTFFFAYPQKYLWIPDITIKNSMETMTELGFDRNYLYVSGNGEVVWLPGGVYKTSCDIDITYYPFDTQTCSIIFSTLVSSKDEIDLEVDPVYSTHLDDYSESGTWELLDFTSEYIPDSSTRTKVSFQLKLKRRSVYYVVAIIFPVLFLSFTATLVFALPADSGEKMGTSITVLLAFAVYLTIVSDQMPQTSLHVSILSLYLILLLGQTSIGVVLSVWILNLHFREDSEKPPGRVMRRIAFHMQRLMRKREWHQERVSPVNDVPTGPEFEQNMDGDIHTIKLSNVLPPPASAVRTREQSFLGADKMTWKEVAYTYDRFLFYVFSIFLFLASVIFLIILGVGGQT